MNVLTLNLKKRFKGKFYDVYDGKLMSIEYNRCVHKPGYPKKIGESCEYSPDYLSNECIFNKCTGTDRLRNLGQLCACDYQYKFGYCSYHLIIQWFVCANSHNVVY